MLLGVKCRSVGAFTVRDVLPDKCSISMCYELVLAPMVETMEGLFAFLTIVDERLDDARSNIDGVVGCWIKSLPIVFTVGVHRRCHRFHQDYHHHQHHRQSQFRSHFGSSRCWTSAPKRLEPRWNLIVGQC